MFRKIAAVNEQQPSLTEGIFPVRTPSDHRRITTVQGARCVPTQYRTYFSTGKEECRRTKCVDIRPYIQRTEMTLRRVGLVRPSLAWTAADAGAGGHGVRAAWRERCRGHARPVAAAPATRELGAGVC